MGIEAACKDERCCKQPYKFIGEIRLHIKELIRTHPDWSDQKIADRSALDLKMEMFRSTVSRIRNEKLNKNVKLPDKKELMESAALAEQIVAEHSNKVQLWLNFDTEPELRAKAEEFLLEPAPLAASNSQNALLDELQKGRPCAFVGGFMHHLFLQEIGFDELVASYEHNSDATYQGSDILATMFHSVTQEVESIEGLKLINASDFGLLIGRSRIPDKETKISDSSAADHENDPDLGNVALNSYGNQKSAFLLKYYHLFNLEQCEGITAPSSGVPVHQFTPIEKAEQIVTVMMNPPEISYGGNKACYSPITDKIRMPTGDSFENAEQFYSVLLHELSHSVGHQSRLARKEVMEWNELDQQIIQQKSCAPSCQLQCCVQYRIEDGVFFTLSGELERIRTRYDWDGSYNSIKTAWTQESHHDASIRSPCPKPS